MSNDLKALEQELAELVKRSRALSVEMSQVSERMLELNAELTRRRTGQPETVKEKKKK